MKRILPLIMLMCLLTCSTFIFAQNPCNIDFDPNVPGTTTAADAGLSITDVDMSTNYLNASPYSPPGSTGGAGSLTITDGTEFCDENGNGTQTGSEEGPDLVIMIPVPPENQLSCADGTLTICLRGDFNNACEVAFIADGSGAILSQSTTTGNPACAGPPTCLDIIIPACDLNADAVDGMILFEIRTNGEAVSTGATGDQVDDTCTQGADAVDLSGDGNPDGNCMTFESFVWPTTVPEIVCPGDVTIECTASTDPADTGEPTFTGECVDDASFTFEDVVEGTCPTVITRTWTATICNDPEVPFFELTCDQIITVEDTTPPVITCPEPADTPLLCGEVPMPGQATATDNCTTFDTPIDGVPDLMPDEIDPCVGGVITYLFTAIDECGLEAMCMQTFTYEPDTEAPVLSDMPVDVDLVCGDPIPEVPEITATDNCTDPQAVVFEEVMMGTCPEPTAIMRTWTATDDCGNETTYTQTINIPPDVTPPVLSDMPADLNLTCADPIPPADMITATDDCTDPIDVIFEETDTGMCPEDRVITRTWTATDACMNETTYTQTITIAPDATPPVLSDMPADENLTCTDPIPASPTITATDDCTDPVTVVFDEVDDMGVCPEPRIITRTWTATDECMNETTYTQTITVAPDVTPPVLSDMPADLNLTCADPIPPADAITATDDCTDPQDVVFEETDTGMCPEDRVITRTWTATDECGNETTYTQTITIAPDTTPPVLSDMPADLNLICTDAIPPADAITATDDCTDPVVPVLVETDDMGVCPDPRIITRTWTATDECMNETTYTQTITIAPDVTPPVLSDMPANVTLACGDPIPEVPAITATDDCTDPQDVVFEETTVGTCPEPTVIMRTWTATDECGNETTYTQTIDIPADDVPPVLSDMPADLNLICTDAIPPADMITATDDCTVPQDVVFEETDDMGVCPDPRIITRTWTATDACMNETTYTQTITVAPDVTPPVLSDMPADLNLTCADPIPPADMITATDDCTDPQDVVFEETDTGMCPEDRIITRTWTATDECGNETTYTQTITIAPDTTPPVLSDMPADLNLICTDAIPPADAITATDDCTDPQDVVFEEVDDMGVCPEPRIITRTWTATDECMNETTYTQTITIAPDTTPPVLSEEPADVTLACGDPIPEVPAITATDDCTDPQDVVFEETTVGTCPEPTVITRTWTATDECGNETTYTQTIDIPADDVPPVLSDMPADLNLICTDAIPPADMVTATDDCTVPQDVVFEETDDMGVCPDPRIITRTWTATDACMNETTYTQTITVAPDVTPPVLSEEPADENLTCADAIPPAATVTATDDCTDPQDVVFEEVDDMGVCPDPRIITRTWTATDECGNETTYTQTITIAPDTTPPVITCPPDDPTVYTLETDIPAAAADLTAFVALGGTAMDDCGEMTLTSADEVTPCPGAANQGMIVRTYTITDECGNEATCDQTFLFSCCDAEAGALNPIDNICIGQSITASTDGTEAPLPDYGYDYVLTDPAGIILAGPNTNGMFTPTDPGTYCVYGVSYQVATGNPNYASLDIEKVTQPVNCIDTTSVCFTVTDPPTVTIGECPGGPAPTNVYTGLEGTYPMDMIGILPDIYVFCEPGCVEATGAGGTAPLTYEWFELSDECGYDFNAPIANTPDASGLGTGTYSVVVTDDNGCTATGEVKVFVDEPPMLTASADTTLCANATFDLEGTSLPGPGICLEYCAGALPVCIIDDNTIFNVCFDFTYTWISDLNLQLQAPNGTILTLVSSQAYPNPDMDGNLCFTNDASVGGGVLPGGALDALNWNNYPGGFSADAAGLGIGVSGNWFPEGGQGAFSIFNGIDANSGTWQVIILDDLPGFEGFFNTFTLDIVNPDCEYSVEVDINQPIIDFVPTTIMTEPIECEELANCTATYQWTGSDGFDSGLQTIANQTDILETFPPTGITPPPGTTTYTLTVTDCFGCVSTEEVVITVADEVVVEAASPICDELDITAISGGTPDYTVTIGMMPDASDALATATITDASAMNEFTGLAAGDYYVAVVDANGCTALIGPITVESCCDITVDIGECTAGPAPNIVYEDLEGTYPDGQLDTLPDVYVFCEPGCVEAFPTGGTEPLMYEWFELSDECSYDFSAPIANTPDASGLGTGTYSVVVTDANGCTATQEVKVFVDEDDTLTVPADTTLCAVGPFDLEGSSLPSPGFCLEYCGGALPVCPIDADAIITVCLEFTHTYISDLSFDLVAPDGTVIPLVMGQCCPNGSSDASMFCFTNDTSGGAVALDWNTTGAGNTDLLGTGAGISGDWLPTSGAGAFSGLAGIDANGGPWAMTVTDIIGGDSGQFESFNVTIAGTNCNTTFQSPVFGAPIPDTQEAFTYETPVEECVEQPNCTASYQWTGDDGTDSGVQTIANQSDQLETFPPFTVNPPVGTTTYTLTVTDCFGCISTEEVVVTVGEITAMAVGGMCDLDITDITGGTPDYTITIGMMPDASDAIATTTVTDVSAMPEFMDLDPGDYYVSIVDADGCEVIIGPVTVMPCGPDCDDFMVDVAPCAAPMPNEIYEDLIGIYPMDMLDTLPDVYVFCEPGCASAVTMGGTPPLVYEWFQLSMECGYDFNAPIASTQDASGLESGVYAVVVTDDNGCTGTQEVKIFVDTPPELTTSDDAVVCVGETFDLEGASLPTPGFCLEYCEGELPVCLVDDNTIFTVCFDFQYSWISDLNLILEAPNGTQLVLVSSVAYPNSDMDGNMCFTNDASVGGGVLPGGALDALNWTNYPSGTADAAGLGIGISGNWFPEGGQGAFGVFNGVDANSGTWQVIILDDLPGLEGFFNSFTLDIINPDCEYSVAVDINMEIIDFVPTTIETEPIECEDQENCTASYQWTGSDGFDSGVIPIANQQNQLETLPPVTITGTGMAETYILTVTDCFGCVAMDTVMIMACDSTQCTAVTPIMETLDLCSGIAPDLAMSEANILANVADPTQITGVVNWYTDMALTMAYTNGPINHSGASCDPEMTTLYAEVVCNDGTTIRAGQIDITVYPFAEVVPPMDGSCELMVSVPNCPNLMLSGPTNLTGGADIANWDPATGTYTGQNGDMAGTLDFMITGGTAPCDMGTITVDIPACNNDTTACTGVAGIMEMLDLCSGLEPDLSAAEANVLAGVADPAQITGVVNWYTDGGLTMTYIGGPINYSGASCDPEITTLYAEVVCNDGTTIPAGQIDITVYPFAEVVPPDSTSCVVMVSVPNCPNLTLSGPTNPTGGADIANWDAATGTYTGQNNDAAGTLDFVITGGTAPCDMGTITVEIPECNDGGGGGDCDDFMVDIGACTAGPAPNIVYEGLEGTYPDGQLDTLPDVYVFCDPGCVEAFPVGGTAPLTYQWFELSDECSYDFNAPIASTPDASGLGTGTYTVIVTDADSCTATAEVKVFIDDDPTLTTNDDMIVCEGETFDLEGTSLPGPGFCLEYCGGSLPQCIVDADAIITVCLDFTHTFISDLSFELVAPDGTVIPLVMAQCCPNGSDDASMFCFTNDTSGGAIPLDWTATAGNTDLLGTGAGISGNWLPEGGAGVLSGLAGIDANGGPWAMIVTDIVGGDSGQFESFNVTIAGTNCNTVFQSPVFGAPIPDTQESFTYETPVEECVDQENCTASYQWTGSDGFDSGVIPIANQQNQLETFPPVPVTATGNATYVLTVTDCFGCTAMDTVMIMSCDSTACTTVMPAMDVLELCGGIAPDLSGTETAILGSVGDLTQITGVVEWYTDAGFTMPYMTGTPVNHSDSDAAGTCNPGTVTLYAELVCVDGTTFSAGTVTITVYPFAEVMPPGDGSCVTMVSVPNCPNLTLSGPTNPTGGADVANWDAAAGTYTGQINDTAGTLDFMITGGMAPCDMGTLTVDIAACTDTTGTTGFDLALIKTLSPGQAATVAPGDNVSFDITVTNQGTIDAFNILVNDYVPAGYTYDPALNPAWADADGDGNPDQTIAGPLTQGATQTITIILTVNDPFVGGMADLVNYAEISAADDDMDPNNTPPTDTDSTPNNDPTDDAGGTPGGPDDDYIDGDGTGNPNDGNDTTDEDDQDPAFVDEVIDPNDCTTLDIAMETLDACGGTAVDLAAIEAAILSSVGDATLITGVVEWYFDNGLTMPYTAGGPINHSDSDAAGTCDPGTVILYGEVVCLDGEGINAGTVTITVYPFAEVTPPADGSCVTTVAAANCPNLMIGAASNPTGGVDLANWDAATGTYTGQIGDTAGTLDFMVTGGTAPCDMGTITVNVPACTDIGDACTTVTPADDTFELCGGTTPDLTAIEGAILGSVGDPNLITGVVEWYFDANFTMSYMEDGPINHSDSDAAGTCDPGTVTLYAQLVCVDGTTFSAGTVTITVYPFAEVQPGAGCTITVTAPNCPNLTIGAASNATGGANLAYWDAATNTYTGQIGDPAGTIDVEVTGGTAPCDAGTITITIPECIDDTGDDCTTVTEIADAVDLCGGLEPDLASAEAAILASVGDASLITGTVNWYFDAGLSMPYGGGVINHSDTDAAGTCDAGTVVLYAEVLCVDGGSIDAGMVTVTIYPFGPEVDAGSDCVVSVTPPNCPNLTINAATNPTGGVSLGNWDGATNTYTGQDGDFPGTLDIVITGGLPPCETGTYVLQIPGCGDDVPCTTTTEPTETLEICGGLTPDLTSIEAAILAGLGDPSLVTGVVWYTDAGYTMPYDNGQVNHSNTNCNPETVTLYAQVVCLTGFEFPAGQVDITVYPFGPSVDTNGCVLTLTPPNCPNFAIGMVSNATGGADLANWDAATNTYTAQDGDAAGTIDIEITGGTSPCESGTYTLEIGACGFDLALTKTLSSGQAAVVGPGADVSFDITVVNQGTDDAFNVVVTDYVPAGYAFDPALNPAWGDSDGDGNPDQTVAGPIAPGASQTITIILTVMNPFNGTMTDLVNIAEISAADDDNDPNNTPPTDTDSTPNTDPTDDAGGTPGGPDDDYVDGNGSGTPGDGNDATDEDDHDPAFVDVDTNLGGEGCTTLTPAADALELCGGLTPDLAGIESAILASVGDMTLITGDINWYFDGAFTMPYDGGQVNHSNTNCDAETVVLYAEVVCTDGSGIEAGTVTITVYPFGPTVDADGCVAVLTPPSCPNFTIGAASNPTGGVSLANWDAATNTYTAQDGDQAGTLDIEITGGQAPCESGIYTLEIGSCGFDLALIKTLSSGQASTVAAGDNVSFTITVTNQGSEDAFNVVVTDYVPAGYNFDAALNPAWGDSDGDGNPDQTIAGPLATGASQTITIILTVADPFMGSTVDLINVAEISAADDDNDSNNTPPTDVDSTPDTDATDDAGGTPGGPDDDYVDGNGSGNPNDGVADTDEDDHDPAFVNIDGVGDPCTTSTMPVETLTACGGVAPDLSTIEAAILAGIGDPSLITGEVVWYTDANYMTVYDGGPINHDDSSAGGTCDPGILTLYAQVVCVDGTASFAAGQVDMTVYPFGPSITPTGPGCILVIEPACPGDIIGAVSNATGGASIENWDPATNTYTAYEGDLPGSIDIEITSSVPGSPCSGVYTLEIPQCGEPDEVPTVGEWGLIILGLLMAIVAVAGIRQRSTEEEYHTS